MASSCLIKDCIIIRYAIKKAIRISLIVIQYKNNFPGQKTKTNNLVINQYKMLSNLLELALFGWEKYYEGGDGAEN